jgi:Bacterial regulatory proteins, tetR family
MTAAEQTAASIWLRPERSAVGRPAQWSRAEITQAALRIADAEGLDAVSMRRVAAELGTGAASLYLSWAILVRKSVVAVDGVEGLAQVVGERVGGGDGLPSGLDLDGAVAAGCLDEFPG